MRGVGHIPTRQKVRSLYRVIMAIVFPFVSNSVVSCTRYTGFLTVAGAVGIGSFIHK